MIKYGVTKELECDCGEKIEVPQSTQLDVKKKKQLEKTAGGHTHEFKEKKNDQTESEDV